MAISHHVGRMGLRIDTERLSSLASVAYDNALKSNDKTINNYKGHDRSLDSSIYYRGGFVGVGAGWSQLSTANYTKQSFHPSIGVGRDHPQRVRCGRLQTEGCRARRSAGLHCAQRTMHQRSAGSRDQLLYALASAGQTSVLARDAGRLRASQYRDFHGSLTDRPTKEPKVSSLIPGFHDDVPILIKVPTVTRNSGWSETCCLEPLDTYCWS
jgi:hypothetical protein